MMMQKTLPSSPQRVYWFDIRLFRPSETSSLAFDFVCTTKNILSFVINE